MSIKIEPINLRSTFPLSRKEQKRMEDNPPPEPNRTDECLSEHMKWKIECLSFRPLDVNKPQWRHLKTPTRGYASMNASTPRTPEHTPARVSQTTKAQ